MTNFSGKNLDNAESVGRKTEHQDDASQWCSLPEGWVLVSTQSVFTQIPTTDKKIQTKSCLPFGRFPVIDQGQQEVSGFCDDETKVISSAKPIVIFGDHTRVIKWVKRDFVPGADGTKVLVANDEVEPKYFFYQLKSIELPDKGYARHFKFLNESKFVVAPLAEQQQIAQKLDELLAQVDTLKTRLDAIPNILKRFRQSVLAAAVSGRLTEGWRECGASDLSSELKSTSSFEIDEDVLKIYEIPSSWSWSALGNYATCARGKFSVRPRNDPSCFDGEHPFIQIGDLPKEGGFIVSHQQTLNEKGLSVSKKFDVGTTVIAIVGATIGNTGIVTYPVCFPDSLVGISASSPEDNKYIDYYLRVNKEQIRTASYAGGGQPNIKLTILNPLPIPVPPKEEILEIVRRVEQLFAYADQIEQRVKDAQARVNHLTQSILAKAFRGELTADWRAQNPELISGENSATALLERVKVEREAAVKPKRKGK